MKLSPKIVRLVSLNKALKYLLFVLALSLCQYIAIGQDKTIDSLKLALKNAMHDTTRCNILNAMIEAELDETIWPKYNQELKSTAEKNISVGGPLKAFYLKHLAGSLNNIGVIYSNNGDIINALDYYLKSLKILEELNDQDRIISALNNLGLVYENQNEVPKALEYYERALKLSEATGNKLGVAKICNSIGIIYPRKKEFVKALEYLQRSLKIYQEINNKYGYAQTLGNIGTVYGLQGDINTELKYYDESLKIREEIGDKEGMTSFNINIAWSMLTIGKLNEALNFANKGMLLAKELAYPDKIRSSAHVLTNIYKHQGKYEKAFEMYELEIKMRDSINNEETQKAAVKKQLQYAYEKKEAVAQKEHEKELEKQQAIADEKQRKQNIVICSVVAGLILVIVFASYVFKTLRITRKQKLLIEIKSKEVEGKQKEILDSIHYAKRIQQTLIPSDKYIAKNLNRLQKKG